MLNVPPKALVPIFNSWPEAMVRVPFIEKSLPVVIVLAEVVLMLKLFNKLVVPAVVWSKLIVRFMVPLTIKLLLLLPLNPAVVVLVTPPLKVRVFEPIESLPLFENVIPPLAGIIRLEARVTTPEVLIIIFLMLLYGKD